MDSKAADNAKAGAEGPSPVHTTEVLAAAIGAAEQAKLSGEQQANSGDGVPASSPGGGVSEQGSGRLASLVPTLGRFATRAHQASAPYLSYAALASQEAARCACVLRACVRMCVYTCGGAAYSSRWCDGFSRNHHKHCCCPLVVGVVQGRFR